MYWLTLVVETVQVVAALHAIVEQLLVMSILLLTVLSSVDGLKPAANVLSNMRVEEMHMPNFITLMAQMM